MIEQQSKPIEELIGPLNEVERKNGPERLFFAGDIGLLKSAPRVSLVGSRKASARGVELATALAERFVHLGAVIVSGLAEGIDTAAHTAALRTRGKTIGVIGTPLDQFYPPKNRGLQALLMKEQLVLSQFPHGYHVQPKNFPIRNRTMALISHATIIVEAAEKSGSLHQGWEALRLGRPLFMLDETIRDESLTWPREFQKYGAQVMAPTQTEELFFDYLPEPGRGESRELAL